MSSGRATYWGGHGQKSSGSGGGYDSGGGGGGGGRGRRGGGSGGGGGGGGRGRGGGVQQPWQHSYASPLTTSSSSSSSVSSPYTPSTNGSGNGNGGGGKIFVPSASRVSTKNRPHRKGDLQRWLGQGGGSDSDDSYCSSSDEDEVHKITRATGKLTIPFGVGGDDDDVSPRFREKLGSIVKLKAACPLSRTGLASMVALKVLDKEEVADIEAVAKICKGQVSGFTTWESFHAHAEANSRKDPYHNCIRIHLERVHRVVRKPPAARLSRSASTGSGSGSEGAGSEADEGDLSRSSASSGSGKPLPPPVNLEEVWARQVPATVKTLNPPLLELRCLPAACATKQSILQLVAETLPETHATAGSAASLVVNLYLLFSPGGFMKRAMIKFKDTRAGRAALYVLSQRWPHSAFINAVHDDNLIRPYPKLAKELEII